MAKTKKAFSAKRMLALVLTLIMALSAMPVAFAAGDGSLFPAEGITITAPEEIVLDGSSVTGSPALTINNPTGKAMTNVQISISGGTTVTLPDRIEPGTHTYPITGSSSGKQIIYTVLYNLDDSARLYTSYGFTLTRAATTPVVAQGRQKPSVGNYTYVDVTLTINKGVINQTSVEAQGQPNPVSTSDLYIDRSQGTTWDALGMRFTYINQIDSKPWKNFYDIWVDQNGVASFGFGDKAPISTSQSGIEDKWFGHKDDNKDFEQNGPGYAEWNDVYGNVPSVENMQFYFWFNFSNNFWETKSLPKVFVNVHTVDKGALRSAIQAAAKKNYQAADYTEISFDNFYNAYAKANEVLSKYQSTQAEINGALTALNNAVNALVYADADYTALDAAVTAADAILNDAKSDDTYTIASLNELRVAYNAAVALKTPVLNILRQADIDAAAAALNAAVAGLVKFADYSAFNAPIAAFSNLNAAYYDEAAFDALTAKVDEIREEMTARTRLADTEENRAIIVERVDALYDEILSLEMLPANYEAHDAILAEVEAILFGAEYDNYTAETIGALEDAYVADHLKATDGWKIDRQDEIDAATQTLKDAKDALVLKGADKTKLLAEINTCEEIIAKTDYEKNYTEASRNALAAALAEAKTVYNNDKLTVLDKQAVIDALTALQAARVALELNPADYSALNAAIAQRKAEVEGAKAAVTADGKAIYSQASISRVETAIGLAESLDPTLSILEQSDVDDALAALNTVKLEKNPADYSALNAAIKIAQKTLNDASDDYTEASKAALTQAIKDAQAVVATKYDITEQQKVNDAVAALESVTLILKDADYSALNDAIGDAEAFLADPNTETLYTPEAVQAVKDALDAAKQIPDGLDITHQNEIYAAANTLVNAVEQAKGDFNAADLSGLQAAVDAAKAKLDREDIADFTQDSRDALAEAIADAEAVLAREPNITEQNAVNATAAALNAMEITLRGAEYDELEAAVAIAQSNYNDAKASGQYTDDSLAQFKAAIDAANDLIAAHNLTIKEQQTLKDAEAALNVALVYKPAVLDKLNAAIAAAEGKKAEAGYMNYTEASRAAFEAVLAEAIALRDSTPDITKQAAVNDMAAKLSDMKLDLQGADFSALDRIMEIAAEKLASADINTYTPDSVAALKAALKAAENVDRGLSILDQADVDAAVAAVQNALDAMTQYDALTSVAITSGGSVVEGQVLYVKVPWYQTYKSQSVEVGFQVNAGADVKSVKWNYANWSIDNPEATIETPTANTTVIRPNGRGFGARSCWITVTVEDYYGNTVTSSPIKVRFYNWSFQAK